MEQFLQENKSYLTKEINNDKKIHVVIGNEACDLDSVVSALTYGYFLHKTAASSQTLCLPVLNTQKSHFHLKTDTKFLLSKTGISPECLTFRDDLDLHDLHQQGRLSLTLVDHNVLVGGDVALEDSVTMVIDHRPLERKPSDRVKVVQDLVGSCSTLVAGILLDCPEFTLCPLTATLLLGTILVDTVNTSPEAGKTTPLDQEMLRRLTQVVPELDKDKLYADVQEAKNDISALSTREVLEKDLKCVVDSDQSVVMSSIPVSLEVFLCRPDVVEAMNSVMHDRKGQSVVAMTMHLNKGVPCREILIFSSSESETKKLAEFLEKNQEIDLSFRPFTCDLKSSLAYHQGNVKASRKKVLPLVKSYLQAINIPQDDLLLNFDPLGSTANSDSLLDFSDNSAFSSVPRDSSVENTNPVFLLDPGNSNNSSTSQDLLGLFDNSRTNPKINITLPKTAEGPSPSSGIPDLLGDFTEADIMESPLRTPDLMQSLSEASSGPGSTFNSRPGSGYPSHTVTPPETATPPNSLMSSGFHTNNEFTLPSMNNAEIIEKIQQKKSQMVPHGSKNPKGELSDNYPFTPNNSVADVQFDSLAREHSLRTLNNSQMVQQVEQKRRSLGGEVELSSSSGVENVPFTPQNSFVSEQFSEFYSRESSLPSLNNAEMLQRIQEKRAGMGGGGGDIAEDREDDREDDREGEGSVPFTPQNSFMESSFDLIAKEHILPSMNNADMVRQVQKKRSSLSSRLVDTEPAVPPADGPSNRLVDPPDGGDLAQSYSPFTPQNSFVESSLEKYNKEDLDFNSLNSRLLDISQDKVAIAQPLVPNLLDLDPLTFDPTTIIPENVVAKKIAESMVMDAQQTPGSQLLDLGFDDDSDHGDRAAKDHGNSSGTMGKDGTPGAPREGSQSSESGSKKGDSPLQDVAFSLAGELIEHVLENFQPEGGVGNSLLAGSHAAGGGLDVLEPMLVEPVEEKRQIPVVTINNVDPESPLRKAASTNQLIALETDYLSKVDPFHGNYDLVTNQGDREVVESSSFRRISGESPKTVREEILKAISPEKESPATSAKEPSATSNKETSATSDKEPSAGVAGKPGEWNEGKKGKMSADRKMEEGREENEGIKIVVDTDECPSSPLLHAAQNLTEAVIKNAVEVIQSEKKDTLDLQSPPELNVENVTPDSVSSPKSISEKVTPDIETLSESIDEKDSPDLQSSPESNTGKAVPDYKSKEEKAESLSASIEEKSTPDSNSSPESIDEKVSESVEKKDTVSQSSSESNDENVIPSSDTSTESMEEKVIPDSQSSSQSIDEEITHDSQSLHESNEEKVIPDSQSSSRSIDEEITHDSQSSPESNEEKVSPNSQSMFDFDSVDSTEESGSSPSDEASSTTEASYRLSSPECTGGVESEGRAKEDNSCLMQDSDRSKAENSCLMQDSDGAKEDNSCITQDSDRAKEEISCLTQESNPSKADNSCLTQDSDPSKAENSCLTQESEDHVKADDSCLTQESERSKADNSCLTEGSISNESLSSHAGVRSDENLDSVQKSGLSFGSISNESLSSFSGLKSDQNLERAGNVGLSTGSISNESLASYSGVKSDTNLLDLQEEVFSAPNESVPNDPPSIKVTESAKAEVTDESSMVLFKVESDDNLDEKSDEMSRSNEGVSGDTMTTGQDSIVVDEDVQGSESLMPTDLAPTTPVDDEGMLKSASSNEGLASMSTSTDTFGVTDSSAGKTAAAENLDETKKTPSNDMTDQEKKFKDRLGGLDLSDEWQEDDIPGMPPAENVSDSSDSEGSRSRHSSNSSYSSTELSAVRSSLSAHPKKKITANLNILSDDLDDDGMDPGDGLEWENDTPIKQIEPIPQFTAQDEYKESKLWKGVEIGGKSMKIDLKVIEPYKRVLSHGGYYGDGLNAIIIFAGCYLPDRSRRDYQYVMDNLFMYVISTLETLVAEDYMIVYFHGATPRRQMPSFGWLKKCYQMIDRRLRKNLKSLLLIHPTLWLKTIVMMTRPFISAKFSSKLRFVRSLSDLGQIIPMEYINVPEQVQQYDDRLLQHRARVTSPLSQSPEPLTSPS